MSNKTILSFVLSLAVLSFPIKGFSKWIQIKNPDELAAIYSDTTLTGTFKGRRWTGYYCAEGTGVLHLGGRERPRKWWVEGQDKLCIEDKRAVCYHFYSHDNKKDRFRGVATSGDIKATFKREIGRPDYCDQQ